MPVISQRRPLPQVFREPNERAMLESAEIGRCAVCMFQWEASKLVMEDGHSRCPRHRLGDRSEERKAEITQVETERMAEFLEVEFLPQISDVKLTDAILGSIRKITNNLGVQVYESKPLRLVRGVADTLLLLGRNFSTSDVITGPSGMTISVAARTAIQTTLTVTAGMGMASGDGYQFVFNGVHYRSIFSVR